MRTDAEIEHEVEALLIEQARPMPADVLETVLGRFPAHPQVAPAGRRSGWLARMTLAATVGVVAVLAVFGAPVVVDQVGALLSSRPADGGPETTMRWDAMRQFSAAPDERNPAPDGYGHPLVFSYLYDGGFVHDPSHYVLLRIFESGTVQRWHEPAIDGLYVGWSEGIGRLELQPSGGGAEGHAAIVAWRSPVDAAVLLSGEVEVDASCGDGIRFSIDRGAQTIETFGLPIGVRTFTQTLEVSTGDTIYLIVEPGSSSRCDTTWLSATFETQ
jgi:hypothetical protein